MPTQKDYTSSYKPTWCPGCGNFGISPATKMAYSELGLEPHQIAMVFGIGCSSNGSNFYHLYAFHGIHGRALPVAVGVKLANHELTVIADAGDGDAFGEGVSHFIHTARGNHDITYLVHDNRLYSLTKGQTSPTSAEGTKTKTTPAGSFDQAFNPLATALIAGATFVAQGFSGDIRHLADLIKQGITHKGFAFINILQICPTFNKVNSFNWFKDRIYKVEEEGHNPADLQGAIALATRLDGRAPVGVIYAGKRLTYTERLPQIRKVPLIKQSIDPVDIRESLTAYA